MTNSLLIYDIAVYIAVFSVLLPISIGFYKLKALNKILTLFLIYLIVCLISDVTALITGSFGIHNIAITFTLLQSLTFLLFYLEDAGEKAELTIDER